ncbi:MAG: NAD-dependent deacylase [Deferribacteres bacterium]|nr:NAD-dependent deacylase [Deferribacteres bacterium]
MKLPKEFIEALRAARKLVVLTGAGISAESGVPTFRGKDGLWKRYRPEELATPFAFKKNPKLVWEWYDWRRSLIAPLEPNEAHRLIAELEERYPEFALITQNIDGLHKKAGSKKILELHGNIWRVRCTNCPYKGEDYRVPLEEVPPKCPECGALLRPDVVWFGEPLDAEILNEAVHHSETCDLMLVIGTSGVVQPAASLPLIAKNAGAKVAEVNPESTPITSIADWSIRSKAVEFAQKLKEHLKD